MADEELIDVGDGNEKEVEIDLDAGKTNDDQTSDVEANLSAEENPNVADQLVGGTADSADPDQDNRTPEERYNQFLEADPEAAEYSKKVKKRIDKLTYKYHEEERQKAAALQYAESVKQENENLKQQATQGQQGYLLAQQKALNSELEQAKSLYKEAHTSNDPELLAEASQNIAKFSSQLNQVDGAVDRMKRGAPPPQHRTQPEAQPRYQFDQQAQPQQPQQPNIKPPPDEKAQAWAERNEWFGEDNELTQASFAIHQQLVAQEGYVPSSDAYYDELDGRLRKNYPKKFPGSTPTANQATMGGGQQTVTPGNGTGNNGSKRKGNRVKLSPSQVAIAKKLGVPLEEYAKYV